MNNIIKYKAVKKVVKANHFTFRQTTNELVYINLHRVRPVDLQGGTKSVLVASCSMKLFKLKATTDFNTWLKIHSQLIKEQCHHIN